MGRVTFVAETPDQKLLLLDRVVYVIECLRETFTVDVMQEMVGDRYIAIIVFTTL